MKAKVLQLDRQKQRLSLGLKPSYFEGEDDNEIMQAVDGNQAESGDELDLDADMAEVSDDDESSAESSGMPCHRQKCTDWNRRHACIRPKCVPIWSSALCAPDISYR